ncbi:DDB1- and CUL4-associated factor 8, partial [Stegodyphus mimosarum]
MESSSSSSNKSKRPTKLEASAECCDGANSTEGGFSAKGPSRGKRMKKEDSGINVIPESDSSDDSTDCDPKTSHMNGECDALKIDCNQSELSSPDSGNLETCSLPELEHKVIEIKEEVLNKTQKCAQKAGNGSKSADCVEDMESETTDANVNNQLDSLKMRYKKRQSTPGSDDEEDDHDFEEIDLEDDGEKDSSKNDEQDKLKYDPTPNTPRPKYRWSAPKSVISRQYGYSSKYYPDLFRYNCYGSLHMVERLELMYKMKQHDGCVNALNFNTTGTKLASGSDDLGIIIWDWTISKPLLEYSSGHRSNVFQAKFMPLSNDCYIVSCARDGQVRIGELSSEGVCKGTRKIAQHKGAAHKLAVTMDSPHTFYSCGEDAVVFGIDIRKEKPDKFLTCKENDKKIPLYSLHINPQKPHECVLGGRSQYVKVYDTRYWSQNGFVKNYCPEHLVDNEIRPNVTCVVYNYNGQEILASYNDEDIYTFDSKETDPNKYLHRYRGHRNSQTIKGVSYFGAKSEFIVSGSDCGFIFFWEKESEHIVRYMYGDEGGVVNCLEPNPNMPVLASSGLDDDIKIWVPSCEEMPNMKGLRNHIISNMKERDEDRKRECPDAFVDQTIWFLMQHLARARSRRRPVLWSEMNGDAASSNSSSSDSDNQDEESEFPQAIQCNQS